MRAAGITRLASARNGARRATNHLDMFEEMRLAGAAPGHAPRPWRADPRVTRLGNGDARRARAHGLGLEHEIGSIEPGKRADLIVIDRDRPAPCCRGPIRVLDDRLTRLERPTSALTIRRTATILVDGLHARREWTRSKSRPTQSAAAREAGGTGTCIIFGSPNPRVPTT